ncbi:hypothetical protein Tsubulata_004028 [Turnera subulata]|uniref:F-box domain-containing protein n=1 Tax=Turnera subulata TaxID=218843 RepID=A0A9Q0GDM7_9ROSI|nr:hypothetical protein Tsubulata_004028 [Turnera subulata]
MGANQSRKLMLQPTTTRTMAEGNPTVVAASSIQELPDSLLMEIILRLPSMKFAIQCQLVCKNWHSLISTPFFLKSLKDRLLARFSLILIRIPRSDSEPFPVQHVISCSNQIGQSPGFNLEFLPCFESGRLRIAASYNDLLLCHHDDFQDRIYYLCNPLTQQWVAIPPFPDKYQKTWRIINDVGMGIGLMCDEKKFMVVRIHAQQNIQSFNAEIFSSETNQWREVTIEHPYNHRFHLKLYLSVNYQSVFCWNGTVFIQNGTANIMAYDFSEPERCNIITMPEDPEAPAYSIAFGVYQGSYKESLRVLQLSCPDPSELDLINWSNGFLRVWELEEYQSGMWRVKGETYNNETEVDDDDEEEVPEEHCRGQWSFKGEAYWKEIICDDAILKEELESDCPQLFPLSLDPYDEDIVQFATANFDIGFRVYSCNLRTKEVKLVDGTIPLGDSVVEAFQIPLLRHCPTAIPRISTPFFLGSLKDRLLVGFALILIRIPASDSEPFSVQHVISFSNQIGQSSSSGFNFEFLPCFKPGFLRIAASYNDLLLCHDYLFQDRIYYLCNPVTRQWTAIPPFPEKYHDPYGNYDQGTGLMCNENKCMVVRIHAPEFLRSFTAEFFSSETNQWREVTIEHPYNHRFLLKHYILRNYQSVFCWNGTVFIQNGFNNIMAYDLSEPERCNIITMPEDPAAMLSRVTFGVYQGFPKESLRVLQLSVPAGFVDALSYGVLRVWELEEYHSGKWSIKGKAYNNVTVVEQEVAGEEEEEEEEEVEEVAGELEEEDEEEELLEEHRRGQWSFKGEAYWKEIIYDDAILKKELESDRLELYPLSLDPYDEDIVQFATARYSDCIRVYSCNLRTKEVKLVDGTIPIGDRVEGAFQIPLLRQCPATIPRIS